MDELKIIGKQNVKDFEFTGIEGGFGEGKRAMLVKEIAEIHEQPLKEVNRRINNNVSRFKKNVDIIDLKNGGSNPPLSELGFSARDVSISNNIYLLSERGYAKLLKILEDDKAWEMYDALVDNYFNMRKKANDFENLSPQLQLLIGIEIEQKAQSKRIDQIEQKQESIKEIIGLNVVGARDKVTSILNKIATALGGGSSFRDIRVESYRLLESRAQCNLSIRQTNKRKKMALEGVTKTAINKITKLDVILDDSRLSEIYFAVVKEMAIHNGIDELESA